MIDNIMNSEIIYLEISFTSNPKRMELLVRNLYKISPVTKNKANRQNQKISNAKNPTYLRKLLK